MKKIILSRKQVTEIIGADFSYLDKESDNFNDFNSGNETVTSDTIDGADNTTPLTTDKFAKTIAPRYFYGHRDIRGSISCGYTSKKNNIYESNSELDDKKFIIPDYLLQHLVSLQNKYKNKTNINGFKRLTNMINMRELTTNEMYQLKNTLDNTNNNSLEYDIIGGNKLKNWVNKELNNATGISYINKKAKKLAAFLIWQWIDGKNAQRRQEELKEEAVITTEPEEEEEQIPNPIDFAALEEEGKCAVHQVYRQRRLHYQAR